MVFYCLGNGKLITMLTSWIRGCFKQIVKYTIMSFLGKKTEGNRGTRNRPMKTPSVSPNIQAYDAIIHPFQVRQQTLKKSGSCSTTQFACQHFHYIKRERSEISKFSRTPVVFCQLIQSGNRYRYLIHSLMLPYRFS